MITITPRQCSDLVLLLTERTDDAYTITFDQAAPGDDLVVTIGKVSSRRSFTISPNRPGWKDGR